MEFKKIIHRGLNKRVTIWSLIVPEPLAVITVWILLKLSRKITPNQITYLRLFVITPLALFFFLFSFRNKFYLILGALFFFLNHYLDNVDGIMARALNKTSEFGRYIDGLADRLSNLSYIFLFVSLIYITKNFFMIELFSILLFFRYLYLISDWSLLKFNFRIKTKDLEERHIHQLTKKIDIFSKQIKIYGRKRRLRFFSNIEFNTINLILFPILTTLTNNLIFVIFSCTLYSIFQISIDIKRVVDILYLWKEEREILK